MRHRLLAVALISSLAACHQAQAPNPQTGQDAGASAKADTGQADARFADLSKRALQGWLQLSPIGATQIGEHRYDSEIDDLSEAGRQKRLDLTKKILAELDAINIAALSRENQVDAIVLRNQLQYDVWNAEVMQGWAWDPQTYSGLAGSAIYSLMAREFAPLPDRLRSATTRMEKLPALLAQARENLDPARVPRVHAETVAKQNGGILSIVDMFITSKLGELPEADRARAQKAIEALKQAVSEHQKWLDNTLVPNAKGDFRIGQALYDQKLEFALVSSLSRAEIRRRAEAEIERVRAEMYGIARAVLKDKPDAPPMPDAPTGEQQQKAIEAALELAYADRPARDKVVEAAEAALATATGFVREKD
ncbi:MAG TPA: DUF885 family protein, partial [Pseudoxanthomonas sp.]|nr:DUF885 family protein [Pseudoxanthomonas sp.]